MSSVNKRILGITPLMVASRDGRLKEVKDLIKRGADVNAVRHGRENPCYRCTPLIFASQYGHLNVVKELLKHGAYPTMKDARGNTALDVAKANKHESIVEVLEAVMPPPPEYSIEDHSIEDDSPVVSINSIVSIEDNTPPPPKKATRYIERPGPDDKVHQGNRTNSRVLQRLHFASNGTTYIQVRDANGDTYWTKGGKESGRLSPSRSLSPKSRRLAKKKAATRSVQPISPTRARSAATRRKAHRPKVTEENMVKRYEGRSRGTTRRRQSASF